MRVLASLLVAVVMLAFVAVPAQAAGQYVVGALGGSDGAGTFFGWRPDKESATEIGIAGFWREGPQWGAAAYATYDVVKNLQVPWTLPFSLGSGAVPVTGYIGVEAGVLEVKGGDDAWDSKGLSAFLTGVYFGDGQIRAGVCERIPIGPDRWNGGLPDATFITLSVAF